MDQADFRCGLCGQPVTISCRWVYAEQRSFFVCALCDGETVVERWVAMHEEATLKAYRMTECEVWAANSIEEAVADYRREILDDLDADDVRELTDAELDDPLDEFGEDGEPTGETTTLRARLAQMTSCGLLAGYEG